MVKMEDFRHKAGFVAGGHMTKAPATITYTSVEFKEKVKIDPESTWAAFRSHLVQCMESLGCMFCKANLGLWLKPEIRPEDGVQHYSYLLHYVDDILCIHHNAVAVLQQLHKSFPLKPGFGNPDMYLGANWQNTRLYNIVRAWAINPVKWLHYAVRNCTAHLETKHSGRFRQSMKAEITSKIGYEPELDISPELEPEAAFYFQTVSSILNGWFLERIGIITEMSLLSLHVALLM